MADEKRKRSTSNVASDASGILVASAVTAVGLYLVSSLFSKISTSTAQSTSTAKDIPSSARNRAPKRGGFESVAGLNAAKEALNEAIVLPKRFPDMFEGNRKPWKGILLYGPPGTGKTYLAKALAEESGCKFKAFSCSDFLSKYVGESEKNVKEIFDDARRNTPIVLFFDEVDSFCAARSSDSHEHSNRVLNEFLVQMQGIGSSNDILVLGATNRPWAIDPAIRRRFEKRIYVPLPEFDARKSLFELNLENNAHLLNDNNFNTLAEITEGYSGADINVVVRDALMQPMRISQKANYFLRNDEGKYTPFASDREPPCTNCARQSSSNALTPCPSCSYIRMGLKDVPDNMLNVPMISMDHMKKALQDTKPTVSTNDLVAYARWTKDFGLNGE